MTCAAVDDLGDPRLLMEDVRQVLRNLARFDSSHPGTDTPSADAAQNLLVRIVRGDGNQAQTIKNAKNRKHRRALLYCMIRDEALSRTVEGGFNKYRATLRPVEDGDELELCAAERLGSARSPEEELINREEHAERAGRAQRAREIAATQPHLSRRFGGISSSEIAKQIGKSISRTQAILNAEIDRVRSTLRDEGVAVSFPYSEGRPVPIDGHRWMTAREAAAALGISRRTVVERKTPTRCYRRSGWFLAIPLSEIENAMRERASTTDEAAE